MHIRRTLPLTLLSFVVEIARLDHPFERGLSRVTADYAINDDGTVKVTNRGYDAKKGKWSEAIGKGRFAGPTDIGSLEVSFFGPFYGGYHVVALDDDYGWAMVIGNNRNYVWILSRTPALEDSVLQPLLRQASEIGVATDALIWVDQQASE